MVVRELVALMGIKTDKKGFQQAESGMVKLVNAAKAAVAAFASLQVVRFVKDAIEEVAQLGDRFDKLSKRTGVSTEMLQKLDHAANLSGASLEDVETSLRKLQNAQVDSASGLQTYTREWKRLGIDTKDSEGNFKDATTLFVEMADGMKNLGSDAERTAVATKLLGRSGTTLIPMFKDGSEALKGMMDELEDFGGIIGEDTIKASADFIDNQRRVDMILQGVKLTISKDVLPWINRATDGMIEWWKANSEWVRQDILRPLGRLIIVFGRIFRVIGKVVAVFAKMIAWTAKFIKNMDPFKKKILAVVAAFVILRKLFMVGPWGKWLLLIGAIVLALDDFFTFLEGGESITGKLNEKLKETFDLDLLDAIEGVNLFFYNLQAKGNDWEVVWGGLWDEMWLIIKDWFSLAGEWWATFFTDLIPKPVTQFVEFLRGVFEVIYTILLFPFHQALKFITDIFEVGFVGALDRLRIKVIDWANSVLDTISKPFKAIGKWIAGIGGGSVGGSMPNNIPGTSSITNQGSKQKILSKEKITEFETGLLNLKKIIETTKNPKEAIEASKIFAKQQALGAKAGINTNVQIDIKALPGMDENKLAKSVGRELKRMLNKQNRETMQALTPVVTGSPV